MADSVLGDPTAVSVPAADLERPPAARDAAYQAALADWPAPSAFYAGPPAWAALHARAATYPETPTQAQQEDAAAYLYNLLRNFACPKCREHFARMLQGVEEHLHSRATFLAWTLDAHDAVNARLGRPLLGRAHWARVTANAMRAAAASARAAAALAAVRAAGPGPPPPPPPHWSHAALTGATIGAALGGLLLGGLLMAAWCAWGGKSSASNGSPAPVPGSAGGTPTRAA